MYKSEINPWVRAEMETYNEYTESLIEPESHDRYREVINELGTAAALLCEAQERYYQAAEERAKFFENRR